MPRRLSASDLAALEDLERRVVAVDGGRLKLEMAALREGRAHGLLTHDGQRLVGFVGVYVFGGEPELVGAVDPDFRRRGLASALLDRALRFVPGGVLLVVPSGSAGGESLARSRGGTYHHSEYALVLTEPPEAPEDPRVAVRAARPDDAGHVATLLHAAFGHDVDALPADTLVIEHDGRPVGTLRLTRDGDTAGIYGFAVDPTRQGAGVGRDVLRRVCREVLADGAQRVALEVDVDNPQALRLYTSNGFVQVGGEDYWSLSSAESAGRLTGGTNATGK